MMTRARGRDECLRGRTQPRLVLIIGHRRRAAHVGVFVSTVQPSNTEGSDTNGASVRGMDGKARCSLRFPSGLHPQEHPRDESTCRIRVRNASSIGSVTPVDSAQGADPQVCQHRSSFSAVVQTVRRKRRDMKTSCMEIDCRAGEGRRQRIVAWS